FLFGLLGVVLLIFGATQLMGLRQPKDKSVYALPTMNEYGHPIRADDIETVELVHKGALPEKLVFYRTEQGWKLRQPNVRVDSYQVERIIDQVSRARREEKADVTNSLEAFGLDAPMETITLIKKGGDKEWKL